MSAKKSAVKKPKAQVPEPVMEEPKPESEDPEPQPQETPPTEEQPKPEAPPESVTPPEPEPDTPATAAIAPTIESIYQELESLKQIVGEHTQLIPQLQEALARKRKPVASNGKVQIVDEKTGQIFPSKNNAYQSLLKSGELRDLVDKGIFGDNPAKNTFGWYALVRELPDRFEEVKQAEEVKPPEDVKPTEETQQ